jgi:UDP:flavonoid glycosyltransferase YjiC (YdhE family)
LARIVLNTFGSLGDLHPYLALAIELRRRGHKPVLATSEVYRRKITAEHVEFAAVAPDVGRLLHEPQTIARLWDRKRGSEYLIRDFLLPQIEAAYEDLARVCEGADLLLTHSAAYAGPIVGETLKLRWLSVALQPIVFFSAYDPPLLPGAEFLRHVYPLGPRLFRFVLKLARLRLDRWAKPILKLRQRLGLPPSADNPLFHIFSPYGTLALFSTAFAEPQPDWPTRTRVTGFVYYDQLGDLPNAPADDEFQLEEFLSAGPPPVLFTLGSSAVMHPGEFFTESIAAVHALGVRAVLLAGVAKSEIHNPLPDSICVLGYVPFSKIMPRCAAIVHQGGIGTTAQALRAGRPMLVVPWAHDQPDNANRIERLGIGRVIPRSRYYAPRIADELRELLTNRTYEAHASVAALQIDMEDAVTTACDVIENALSGTASRQERNGP